MAVRRVTRITNNRTDGVTVVFTSGARVRVPPENFDNGSDQSIINRSRPDLGVFFRRVQDTEGINRIQVQVTSADEANWGTTDGWYDSVFRVAGRKLQSAAKRVLDYLNPLKD